MELAAEYAMGGREGLIIVLEGRDRWGWKMFAEELGKVLTAIDSCPRKSNGGCLQPLRLPLLGKELEGHCPTVVG